MLQELQIRNFALIEKLELSFHSGFSVLSGETGAGKSILIDALSLLLGARASLEMIRTGSAEMEVLGSFSLNDQVQKQLDQWGLWEEDAEELIVTRQVNKNGRNKCRLNGRLVTVGQLAELGRFLVDIVGQHDSQSLLNPASHRGLLDAFGGAAHLQLVQKVAGLAREWRALVEQQNRLHEDERERNRRVDLLKFQIEEIAQAELRPDEDQYLELERSRLANLDRLRQALRLIVDSLGGTVDERDSLLHGLALAGGELERAAALDSSLTSLRNRYEGLTLELDDLLGEFRNYLDTLSADPELLQQVELRLQLLHTLQRKYGSTVQEILEYGQAAQDELAELENAQFQVEQIEEQCARVRELWHESAAELTCGRHHLAGLLAGQIEAELADLAMPEGKFKVQFSGGHTQTPTMGGAEQVEFMLSANPGEELKPLLKIASGGELSRVLLAIKAVLAEIRQTPTIIFDEIDAGLGGRTALNLGEKLKELGSSAQVLCVTHLPVVASYGKHHYSVRKFTAAKRTSIEVVLLGHEERVEELTRMLGGASQEAVTAEHARELLRRTNSGS